MITATALMQLYDQGLFSFDDDISTHLGFTLRSPWFPDDTITIGMVASHTASLRDGSTYDTFLSASYSNNPPPVLSSLLIPGGAYYSSSNFSSSKRPADKYFNYANINYGILGTLIEKLSGERFDEYCRRHIFDKLGINASFNIQDIRSINDIAVLYRYSGSTWIAQADNYNGVRPAPRDLSGYVTGTNGFLFGPQGGLRISSSGMAVLLKMQLNNGNYNGVTILSDSSAVKMRTPVWSYNGSNGNNYYGIFNSYGYGTHRTPDLLQGQTLYGHPGEAYGLISDAYFSTAGDYGIVFITNGGRWGAGVYSGWYNIEEEIYNAVLSELGNLPTDISGYGSVTAEKGYELSQNYPNPFNPSTIISFYLPEQTDLKMNLYNSSGELIREMLSGTFSEGRHEYKLSAADLPSGVYFYSLITAKDRITEKMIITK
jgi:CubicO group peptidase (beta-lactamase class C family)